jgi:hypothetical protein
MPYLKEAIPPIPKDEALFEVFMSGEKKSDQGKGKIKLFEERQVRTVWDE